MAPAGTPPAVIGKLEKALAETVAQAEVRRRLADMGTLVTPMNAKEFGAFIQSEMAKWRDAVKSANVTSPHERLVSSTPTAALGSVHSLPLLLRLSSASRTEA